MANRSLLPRLLIVLLVGCTRREPSAQPSPSLGAPAASKGLVTGPLASTDATALTAVAIVDAAAPRQPEVAAPLPTIKADLGRERASLPSKTSQPCELLAVGDSLTDPKSAGGGYLEAVATRCGCHVTNLGRGGDMVNQMRARLLTHLSETRVAYRFIVIFGGVNDLYSDLTAKRSVEKIAADLEKMYRAARANGAQVIAITVAPWGGFRRYFTEHRWQNTRQLNSWIRERRADGLIDGVVDAESLLSCGIAERICDAYAVPFRDGLHFGPEGHRRLSAALTQTLGLGECVLPPDHGPDKAKQPRNSP